MCHGLQSVFYGIGIISIGRYRIADEVVEFTVKHKENELRFKAFPTTSEGTAENVRVEDYGWNYERISRGMPDRCRGDSPYN